MGSDQVLALVPSTYDLSTVVSSLAASLDRVRAPRMQCAVLELFTTGVVQRCHDDLTDEECHSLRSVLLLNTSLVCFCKALRYAHMMAIIANSYLPTR